MTADDLTDELIAELHHLSADPELVELAGINADMDALHDRIDAFLDRHPATGHDDCPACRAIEARAQGGPGLWDYLTSARFVLWSGVSHMTSERPPVVADLPEFRAVLLSALAGSAAADDAVGPDAVVG